VINSNPGSISHRFLDTAIYWLKIAIFSTPSHLKLLLSVTNLWKSFSDPETTSN